MASLFNKMAKGFAILSGARLFEFFIGLLRVKIAASTLGLAGMGIYNQIILFTDKLSIFTLLSTGEGLVKQISSAKSQKNEEDIILGSLKSYVFLICIFLILSISLVMIFQNEMAKVIFGKEGLNQYLFIALLSLPFLVSTSIPHSIMRAYSDMETIAKARVITALAAVSLTIPLILTLSLKGAAISIFFTHILSFFVNIFFLIQKNFYGINFNLQLFLKSKINKELLNELLKFSSFGFIIGAYLIIGEFLCRNFLINAEGIEALGNYAPIFLWSSVITSIILPALSTYLYSSMCNAKDNFEVSSLLNDGIRLVTLILLPIILFSIPFKELIIKIIFSEVFVGAAIFLPLHLLGLCFFSWQAVLIKALSPRGYITQHGIIQFIYISFDILVCFYLVSLFDIWGWVARFFITPFIFFFIYLIFCFRTFNFSIESKNLYMMIYLLFCLATLFYFDFLNYNFINFLLGPFMVISSILFLNADEKKWLALKFKKIIP